MVAKIDIVVHHILLEEEIIPCLQLHIIIICAQNPL